MNFEQSNELPIGVLDALPNAVLVKDSQTRYVWVNRAFERMFNVNRSELIGSLDSDFFVERQAAQCNGGDLRVLETGQTDEAYETIFDPDLGPRETITRKRRISIDGEHFLIGVMHDVTEISQLNDRLTEKTKELYLLATTDSLTGCLNRRALFETWTPRRERGLLGGVAILDIDHFKLINDRFGHAAGDRVIAHVAKTIESHLRRTDTLARIGGEEFALILPDTTVDEVERVLERVRAAVASEPVRIGDDVAAVTVSIGAIHDPEGLSSNLETLLADADRELYRAKSEGRNRLCSNS